MADVRWIKIYTDMISNKKIKRIRKLPEGNNIVLIWVFLLAQAGESNKSGALYLTDTLPFRPEDLAIEFDFEVTVINLALITLERFSMIEVFDEVIFIRNWNEYQNIEGMDKIREQTRLRNVKYREKNKQLLLQSDVSVTSRDAIELELDLELEKEKDKNIVECDAEFERWYSLYPKEGSVRKKAYDSWKILWRDKKIDMDKLYNGTRAYIDYQNHNEYKVCGAQVFLNQQRWNDDWTIKQQIQKKTFQPDSRNTTSQLPLVTLTDEERAEHERSIEYIRRKNGVGA